MARSNQSRPRNVEPRAKSPRIRYHEGMDYDKDKYIHIPGSKYLTKRENWRVMTNAPKATRKAINRNRSAFIDRGGAMDDAVANKGALRDKKMQAMLNFADTSGAATVKGAKNGVRNVGDKTLRRMVKNSTDRRMTAAKKRKQLAKGHYVVMFGQDGHAK